jgi:hypothetical protein
MKKLLLITFLLINALCGFACPACSRNQPKILRGIVHGAGPESRWDFLIVWTMVAIVVCTLFFSAKWLIWPGEKSDGHIKRFILNNE